MKRKSELVTIAQFAKLKGRTVSAIYKAIGRGKLVPVEIAGVKFVAVVLK